MRDPDDIDKTNHGTTHGSSGAREFAGLVGEMLAERDAKMDKRLDAIQQSLKNLADAFLGFNEARRDDEQWRAQADLRFAQLEARVAKLERMPGE